MDNTVIRKARRGDCARLLELIGELAEYEKEPDAVTVSPDHFEQSGFGKNHVWQAFVAEIDGVIRGFALYYVRYSTWRGKRMYVEDFYVQPDYRRRGIGAMIFERTIEEARSRRFSGIMWQVLSWNEPAIAFYRKYPTLFDDRWINCSIELAYESNNI